MERNIIYRVALRGLHCRSSVELVNLKIMSLEGAHAASVDNEGTLVVMADADLVSSSDILRTLIDAGVTPASDIAATMEAAPIAATPVCTEEAATEPSAGAAAAQPIEATAASAEDAPIEATEATEAVHAFVAQASSLAADAHAATETAPASASTVGSCDWADTVAHEVPEHTEALVDSSALEESIKSDLETPDVPVSPRASLVQRIKVVVSDNYYPNRIEVIAGIPIDIEFSEGHGCLASVLFEDFGIEQDLTEGGATVSLPGLEPGTYNFSCGMRMVFGTVVAEI